MQTRQYTIFSTLHPALLCIYAFGAPFLTMLSNAPWYLTSSVISAVMIHWFYLGIESTKAVLKLGVPFGITVALFNFITNPRGSHILFEIGNRLFTWESLLYGIANGVMLAGVIVWFRCFHAIISNDKFLYLFGKKLPGTALMLSMILKLFPETKYKMQCIQMADDSFDSKKCLKKGLRQLSSLLEWSMEDSIETADSMKARGYGMVQRGSYQSYVMTYSDWIVGIYFLVFIGYSAFGMIYKQWQFVFYPHFFVEQGAIPGIASASIVCFLFQLSPVLAELFVRR